MKKWIFDKAHSQLFFEARHLMIANVIGQLKNFTVRLQLKNDSFDHLSFHMTAETSSLSTGDEIRDQHLKAADFLFVEKYPMLQFTSHNLEKTGPKTYRLNGVLSLRGVQKEISLTATFGGPVVDSYSGEPRIGYSLYGEIDRRDWGINFSLPISNGGLAVSHRIKIRAELEFFQPVF